MGVCSPATERPTDQQLEGVFRFFNQVQHGPVLLWQCSKVMLRRPQRQTPTLRWTLTKSSSKNARQMALPRTPSKPLRAAPPVLGFRAPFTGRSSPPPHDPAP
jgi:hypothetical protein